MELYLTNSAHEFNNLLNRFIENKKIEAESLISIDSTIKQVKKYKNFFANSQIGGINIVKLFSGLNLLENFYTYSKKRLINSVKIKENPKSAEEILAFMNDIISLSNRLDTFKINATKDSPEQINEIALELREPLREKKLYPKTKNLNLLKGEDKKIFELFLETTQKNL